MKAVVAGGGIGGLAAAVALHHRSTAPRTLTSACPAAGVLVAGVVYASRRRQMVLRGQHTGRRAP